MQLGATENLLHFFFFFWQPFSFYSGFFDFISSDCFWCWSRRFFAWS